MSTKPFTPVHSHKSRGRILAACLAAMLCAGASYGQEALEYYAVSTADLPIHGYFGQTGNWPGEIYLPVGTRVLKLTVSEDTAVVVLSPEVLSNLDEAMLTTLFDEFRKLFYDVPQVSSIQITCKGKLLSSYLPPAPDVTPLAVEAPATTYQMMTETTGLSGKSICIGPSHGRQWNGSSWGWQRGDSCGFGYEILEDTNSIRLMQYLHQYLTQDGAAVYVPRQLDETDCCHPSENRPFWHMAAYSWLYYEGYPCSVFGSNSGYCSSDLGPDRFSDDIRARPLFADYHNTDIYIAHHTNAYNGSASGTITYRDTAMEHPEHEADSYVLAQKIQSNVCNVITNVYGVSDWYNRGVADSAGGFGEIRIPDRPACLIELAFHDNCTRDALFLIDPWFRSLTMWAIYKGVCDYFSVTPTWDLYSCEYVSDTIPSSMNPGQSYNVSITFTNRGVLWDSDHGFKLGAVGDSDPFAAFNRVDMTGEVGPGDSYTFYFTMTAPTTPNLYMTEWQMVRQGIAWFGPICSKQISVGSGPFAPMITAHPASQSILAGYNATFTVDAAGTPPLYYQWQKNGVNLSNGGHYSGCTTPSMTVSDADGNDAANYRCVVTNAQGSATSNAATLTVQTSPVVHIVESRSGGQNYSLYSETGTWGNSSAKSTASGCTSGIGSRYCTIGASAGTAVFKFTPAAGGPYKVYTTNCTTSNSGNPLIHQIGHAGGSANVGVCQNSACNPNPCNKWYLLGTYTLNAGTQYTVTLNGSTAAGSLPSGYAGRSDSIKWESTGPVATPPSISQHPAAQNVCPGATAQFTVAASGSTPLTYQWQKNQVNLSNGGHYSGCTTATLTVSNADGNDAANYRCVVTNAYGNATSNEAALALKAATAITQHPSNQSVPTGGTANFTVAATGDGTLAYQWQKNQVNLSNGGHYSGCTTATLTVSNCDSSDAANYRCVVTAGCGSATSNEATLTISSIQVIIDDNFDGYANQAAFQAVWPTPSTSLALSTTRYHSSPKSIYSAAGAAKQNRRNFTETVGTDASPITLSFWFYDNGSTGTSNQWVELRDYSPSAKQLIEVGVYGGCSLTYYSARVAYSPGNNWQPMNQNGAPARSVGWHLFTVVIKSTTADFYVDGVLGSPNRAYASSQGSVSFEQIRLGSGYSSAGLSAYYDTVLLTKGQ